MLCRRAVAFVPRRPARAAIARIDSLASAGEDCATNHGKIGDGNTFDTNDYVADSVIDRDGRRCAAGTRADAALGARRADRKSTRSELQSLMRISYAVFCLKKKKTLKLYIYTYQNK